MTLGTQIRNARLELDKTQQQIADKVKCTVVHINRIEHDKATPTISLLRKLSKALNQEFLIKH